MSSPQVIDSERIAKRQELEWFLAGAEKARYATLTGLRRRDELVELSQAQSGRIIASKEFEKKLRSLNSMLMFEVSRSYPDRAGIYVQDADANLDDLDHRCRGRRFITGYPTGMMPENSTPVVTDNKGEPEIKSFKKGWRDTLKVLIQTRLITLEGAERLFGSGGKNWHLKLH